MASILGVDPGVHSCFYVVLECSAEQFMLRTSGSFDIPADEPLTPGICRLIQDHRVMLVGVELPVPRSGQGFAVARIVGRIEEAVLATPYYACDTAWLFDDLPLVCLWPSEVKLAVTGNGAASKRQVQQMVSRLLGLEKLLTPQHASDAAAVAIAASRRML